MVTNRDNSQPIDQVQYLRDFFEHAPIGLHVFGGNRRIVDMNKFELTMIGYSRDEVINRMEWSDLIIEEQLPQFEQHWTDINTKGEVKNLHYTLRRKDGGLVDVILSASARFGLDGRLINTRGTIYDITDEYLPEEIKEFSKPERELIKQKKLLEQKNLVLNQLLVSIEMEKNRIVKNITSSLDLLIAPQLAKLRRKGSPVDRRHVDLLEKSLYAMTGEFGSKISSLKSRLSGRELEICNMIKEGLSTKEIADVLNTSGRTIDNHRNHIRKKLEISGSDVDLASYLRSL